MKKGSQKEMFKQALIYLKQAMKSEMPVMIGLNYKPGYSNDDLITDHFAVITGCGRNDKGLYFDVTDNAFYYQKYYCNCDSYKIISNDDDNLFITQVRKSKKL